MLPAARISKWSKWIRRRKQWKFMRKCRTEWLRVINPGRDSACSVRIARGTHHIESSFHKWTCLFWLVLRIINLPPLEPPPTYTHLKPQIALSSTPFKQISMTARSRQSHHLPEWDHVSSAHLVSRSRTPDKCGSAGERHLGKWKGKGQWLPCVAWIQAHVASHCDKPLQMLSLTDQVHVPSENTRCITFPCQLLIINSFLCSITVYVKWRIPQLMFTSD